MAGVLALFVVLSMVEGPPPIPISSDHKTLLDSSCRDCHSGAGKQPLGKRHTDRPACLKCHKP
jgi:hypothetical protein